MNHGQLLELDGREERNRRYKIGADDEPEFWVRPGSTVCFHTLDASGNQITSATKSSTELNPEAIFPVTGPVGIEGVNPGDGIGIEVVSITPGEKGHIWTRPGLGFGPAPSFLVREVDTDHLSIQVGEDRVEIPPRLMVGTIAVSPEIEYEARDLGVHGGNLDTPELTVGSILWLRAQRTGGRVYAGDVHVAMGEGEICGTGVEVSAEIHLRLHRSDEWAPSNPIVVNDDRVWVIGIGSTLEQALNNGLVEVIHLLSTHRNLSTSDAYLMAATILEVRVCQVVNPHISVAISLSGGMDRFLIPASISKVGAPE